MEKIAQTKCRGGGETRKGEANTPTQATPNEARTRLNTLSVYPRSLPDPLQIRAPGTQHHFFCGSDKMEHAGRASPCEPVEIEPHTNGGY